MSADLAEAIAVTARVAGVLESLGVVHLVGGSVASSVQGAPRATDDADVVAALDLTHVDRLVAALGGDFYADPDMIRDAIRRQATFNVVYLPVMFKVDFFVAGTDEVAARELERRQRTRVWTEPAVDLFLSTPEDTVVQKLAWFQKGGGVSDRQWRDAIGVLRVQGGSLDRTYMIEVAAKLGVSDLLIEAETAAREPHR